ncbi:MBL fold metallo-hydrolase [Vibrio anguillarum]|uniref:Vmh family MBL fold metallo-hydrolase n=1 Tax=Vibrio TaxID=662 RepID=UPI001889DE11|nr:MULTISPECIES: Vmh family MBL fold metallo-hydrolase [Vibrio]MBF4296044.1 MBL fold metallo-hydrolase [Vibrio anguillarum]MCS0351254.1 Vmh family MBL fold metallo-hydrolase [Vibrio ordalii]
MTISKPLITGFLLASTSFSSLAALTFQTYNPGENGVFPVSSTLISGEKQAILIDAQFGTKDGQALVDMIKQSGKELKAIYISAGDPDYYFGLEPLVSAFPNVDVLASQAIVEHIKSTKDAKLQFWGPILGESAPNKIIVPKIFDHSEFSLEGEKIEVKELNTHQAYLWVPSEKTIVGGVAVVSGMHVWTADSQTPKARGEWVQALEKMQMLKPKKVIPGHYFADIPQGVEAVKFTKTYLAKFEQAISTSKDSAQVVSKMVTAYPALPGKEDLELSAQVNMGERTW